MGALASTETETTVADLHIDCAGCHSSQNEQLVPTKTVHDPLVGLAMQQPTITISQHARRLHTEPLMNPTSDKCAMLTVSTALL